MAKGKKAALRVLQDFWSSINEDRFEAQVLDCVAVLLNYAPQQVESFREEYVDFCKRQKFYRMPGRTTYGRNFLRACVTLGLIDAKMSVFGGIGSGQFGWPTQQLHSVDIRQFGMNEAAEIRRTGFFHWYSVDAFTQEQLEWILSGGVVRHTFGIVDTASWEFGEAFELIEG